MKTADFDFTVPANLIASSPCNPRDKARLLHLPSSEKEKPNDGHIPDLTKLLKRDDILIFNNSRVIPARLYTILDEKNIEITLIRSTTDAKGRILWLAFAKPVRFLRGKFSKGTVYLDFATDFRARLEAIEQDGKIWLDFACDEARFRLLLDQHGHMPLPPYLKQKSGRADRDYYQTIFARHDGAIAAPTAGLHFTRNLCEDFSKAGIRQAEITLHVGIGTFSPLREDNIEDHKMHAEWGLVSEETVTQIKEVKARGGRVVAVGTTSLRILEAACLARAKQGGQNSKDDFPLASFSGETSLFITPGFQFRLVDMLLTNFHLPRSTLFVLVSAFSGLKRMRKAYRHAVEQGYRFYSYGDACLLERPQNYQEEITNEH